MEIAGNVSGVLKKTPNSIYKGSFFYDLTISSCTSVAVIKYHEREKKTVLAHSLRWILSIMAGKA